MFRFKDIRWFGAVVRIVLGMAGFPLWAGEVIPARLLPYCLVETPAPESWKASLKATHPRLILTTSRVERIRELRKTDPRVKAWYATVVRNRDLIATFPPVAYEPPTSSDPNTGISPMPPRFIADRVFTLGLLAAVDRDPVAMDLLRREVKNVLDTWPLWPAGLNNGELSSTMALAYDWVHDQWTADERAAIAEQIRDRGLGGYLKAYDGFTQTSEINQGFYRNNVNVVVNGGAMVAAMAVLDRYPDVAGETLTKAFAFLQVALPGFGTDGAWFEGMSYWNYTTTYLIQTLACLDTAFATDFGLISKGRYPGVPETGNFLVTMTSPTGRVFNFADDEGIALTSATLLYIARKWGKPLPFQFEAAQTLGSGEGGSHKGKPALRRYYPREVASRVLYYEPMNDKADVMPLEARYPSSEVMVMRGAWADPKASFVGLKGGMAQGNRHAHLDAGSVTFDALGERWIEPVGRGPYSYDYFHEARYEFFHTRNESHPTILVNPEGPLGGNQILGSPNPILPGPSAADFATATVDLTASVEGAKKILRHVTLTNGRKDLVLRDEVVLSSAAALRWHAYSKCAVSINPGGTVATFRATDQKNPSTVTATLISPEATARFVLEEAAALPGHGVRNPEAVKGFTRLAIVCPPSKVHDLTVVMRPNPGP